MNTLLLIFSFFLNFWVFVLKKKLAIEAKTDYQTESNSMDFVFIDNVCACN